MSDLLDVLYRLRNMAGVAAGELRTEVAKAQAVLDRLEAFAHDAEDTAQLAAASDMFPSSCALIPERSGLARKEDRCDADMRPRTYPQECPE